MSSVDGRTARSYAARVVLLVAVVLAMVIFLAVVFTVADANTGNWVVRTISGWARWLTTPFHDMFVRKDPKQTVAINYLISALLYLGAAGLIARALR